MNARKYVSFLYLLSFTIAKTNPPTEYTDILNKHAGLLAENTTLQKQYATQVNEKLQNIHTEHVKEVANKYHLDTAEQQDLSLTPEQASELLNPQLTGSPEQQLEQLKNKYNLLVHVIMANEEITTQDEQACNAQIAELNTTIEEIKNQNEALKTENNSQLDKISQLEAIEEAHFHQINDFQNKLSTTTSSHNSEQSGQQVSQLQEHIQTLEEQIELCTQITKSLEYLTTLQNENIIKTSAPFPPAEGKDQNTETIKEEENIEVSSDKEIKKLLEKAKSFDEVKTIAEKYAKLHPSKNLTATRLAFEIISNARDLWKSSKFPDIEKKNNIITQALLLNFQDTTQPNLPLLRATNNFLNSLPSNEVEINETLAHLLNKPKQQAGTDTNKKIIIELGEYRDEYLKDINHILRILGATHLNILWDDKFLSNAEKEKIFPTLKEEDKKFYEDISSNYQKTKK